MEALRVLVADDNELNQKVLVGYLEYLGHGAEAFASGDEALTALQKSPFDAALLDIQMPGLDGFGVVTALLDSAKRSNAAVPFLVATTGVVRSDGDEHFLTKGFDAYLAKPIELELLKATLAQVHPDR